LRAAQPAAAWAGSLVAGAWLAAAAAAASRAAFQRLGSRSGRSLRRTRRASRGSTSRRYSTGLTSARRQQARMVYAIAARSAARVRPREEIVLSGECRAHVQPLHDPVVDRNRSVLQKARQRLAVVQGVLDRFAQRRGWWLVRLIGPAPCDDVVEDLLARACRAARLASSSLSRISASISYSFL